MQLDARPRSSKMSLYRKLNIRNDESESITIEETPDKSKNRLVGVRLIKQGSFKKKLNKKNKHGSQKTEHQN